MRFGIAVIYGEWRKRPTRDRQKFEHTAARSWCLGSVARLYIQMPRESEDSYDPSINLSQRRTSNEFVGTKWGATSQRPKFIL